MKSFRLVLMCSGILLLAPVAARAQLSATAFIGGNFGGDTNVSLSEGVSGTSQLAYGFRIGLGGGLFGFEFDYGHTPNFYGKGTVFDSSAVTTMMGSLALGVPAGSVRPYLVAGIGLIKRTITRTQGPGEASVDITDSRAAYDLGGGLSIFFGQHVGVTVDLRYFRNFTAGNVIMDYGDDKFNFSRATVGVTVKF